MPCEMSESIKSRKVQVPGTSAVCYPRRREWIAAFRNLGTGYRPGTVSYHTDPGCTIGDDHVAAVWQTSLGVPDRDTEERCR